MKHNGSSCLVGEWRSVGSLPPDKAVWGRPSYALPVWRSVIINTAERILTRWPIDRSLRNARKATLSVERKTYAVTRIFPSGLEIPMAVTTGLNENGLARVNKLVVKVFLKKAKPPYKTGLNYIEFKAPDDRYTGQLRELARILRGEIPNPPGLYEHDLKVHKVSLDACNL